MIPPREARRFELAERLGMTVEELGERMSNAEFLRWSDYDLQKPHGEGWEQAALICSTLANAFAGKGTRRAKPSDFLPPRARIVEPPSPEALKSKIGSFRDRHNAAVRAKGG